MPKDIDPLGQRAVASSPIIHAGFTHAFETETPFAYPVFHGCVHRVWNAVGVPARALFAPGDLATRPSNVDVFESGPQVGSKVPGAFHPFNINGKAAGDEECLFCRYGDAPVAMVFASKLSPQVPALVRGLEKAATAAAGEVGACLIVTENNAETKSALTKLADAENLKRVVLAMIESRDLKKYCAPRRGRGDGPALQQASRAHQPCLQSGRIDGETRGGTG